MNRSPARRSRTSVTSAPLIALHPPGRAFVHALPLGAQVVLARFGSAGRSGRRVS